MKVNSFFCGAGGMDLGFIQAGFEVVGAWDFDKYAVESYKRNIGDHVKQMSVLDMVGADVPKANGWLFGFPCQDISVAGKQAGMIKGETRSGLFYEIMRLLGEVEEKPEWILAENVKAVNKFIPTIREEYELVGYKMVDPQLYNTKFWFLPQNRERYFLMGIREDLALDFQFPTEQKEFIPKLSSVLESEVDEKYYISDEKAAKIIEQAIDGLRIKEATKKGYATATEGDTINISHPNSKTRRGCVGKQVAQTLLTGQEQVVVLKDVHACITPDRVDKRQNGRRAKENEEEMFTLTSQDLHGVIQSQPQLNMLGLLDMKGNETVRRVYDSEGLSPTLTTSEGGHRQPKILVKGVANNGYANERNTDKTLSVLQQANGTQTLLQQGANEPASLQQTGLLQSGVYEESIYETSERKDSMGAISQNSNDNKESGSMRGMPISGECGNSPQRRELAEQRTEQSSVGLSELSFENTQTETEMQDMRQTTQRTGILRETLSEIQETRRSELHYVQQYRVRKLTPTEYKRLQGFPDSYEQVVSNSQFYKQMGNAVSITVAHAIAKAIKEQFYV